MGCGRPGYEVSFRSNGGNKMMMWLHHMWEKYLLMTLSGLHLYNIYRFIATLRRVILFFFSISEIEGISCWCPSWRKVISFALQHCGMPRFNSVNTQMHAFWLLHAFCANILSYLQGKSADSLAHYFGEDPVRCPFEQGIFFWAERHN